MTFRKPGCLLLAASLCTSQLIAQRFMQSVGSTISVMHTKGVFESYEQTVTLILSNATYFPRFNVVEGESSSLSVGAPLSFGIGIASNVSSYSGENAFYWGFDAPLVLDYNIGAFSSPENEDKVGGYFGGGFGYTYTSWSGDLGGSFKASSYGPLVRAGVRFGFNVGGANMGLTVGFYYKKGMEEEKFKTYGMNLLFDF